MRPFIKLTFASLLLFLFSTQAQAQVDLKLSPFGLLFSNISGAAEFGVSEKVGIDVGLGYNWNSFKLNDEKFKSGVVRAIVNPRYYFNTKRGLDGFYAGFYTRYANGSWTSTVDNQKATTNRLAVGFNLGAKIVASNERLVFDFGIGAGRAFVNKIEGGDKDVDFTALPFFNVDFPLRVAVGYRISGGGSSRSGR